MAAIIKFNRVEIGRVLQNVSTKYTDVFMKMPEEKQTVLCKCGVGFNAINLNGMFTVHFCDNIDVVIDPTNRGFAHLKALIER